MRETSEEDVRSLVLDHVNLRSADVASLARFYSEACGLEAAPQIETPRPTIWIGLGGHVFIHLVESELTEAHPHPQIEHFAFRATGLGELLARLNTRGVAHRVSRERDCIRVNLRDPDGNRFHLDFDLSEAVA